jgi:hypothetical protein
MNPRFSSRGRTEAVATLVFAAILTFPLAAQSPDHEAARSLADSALAAISRGDFIGFTDMMIEEGIVVGTSERDGVMQSRARTRAQEREMVVQGRWTERGWNPVVRIAGGVATVWLPYDFYIDGAWSHCGVDTFTMVKSEDRWFIAALAYTVEQPPACERHPAGPPGP